MPTRKVLQKTFSELTLIHISDAVKRYKCSRRQIERAIRSGSIDAYMPGKKRFVDQDSADAWFMTTKFIPRPIHGNRKR